MVGGGGWGGGVGVGGGAKIDGRSGGETNLASLTSLKERNRMGLPPTTVT